ncbi:MAG TPA: M1 family aminopeptidase [Streptosporangiaceae bacterium]
MPTTRARSLITAAASLAVVATSLAASSPALARTTSAGQGVTSAHARRCSPGARTLSGPGAHVYPDTGNGGYTSLHTDVHMRYDAVANRFLPGNHVVLTDRATQCLTSFSLDFERKSEANVSIGPDMKVNSVSVNGTPAAFRFVQPTYPGDPRGQNDPDPRAHEASQVSPVGGPAHNPLPPACSPELSAAKPDAQDGQQCPANKLVIIPAHPVSAGARFTVTVSYTGRPGVHTDGDGSTEGWFRSDKPAGDGGFVTTEPVGTEDWMPLNDYPAAKPTYDYYDTVSAGRVVLANGILESRTRHAPDAQFPGGSVTFHWHMAFPVASYLVENSVGHYDLTERTADNGVRFYQAQASSLSAAQKKKNRAIMNMQQDITEFESLFNGSYPFTSDGVVVGRPSASFEEEMETMITFAGGEIDTDTLYHENMHQWWGDNVSEGSYSLTFFKEGLATLGEYLFDARTAKSAAGGPFSKAGQRAFQQSLVKQFNSVYARGGSFWTLAPSDPTSASLFNDSPTYTRPGTAYIALRQILGPGNFTQALAHIQRQFGGGAITEAQLEASFGRWLPNRSAACQDRLRQFFREWFDTAYPAGGGASKPQITAPGLAGPGFYTHGRSCAA